MIIALFLLCSFPFVSVGTFAAYLGLHLGRCRMVLAGDVGFLLGLGLDFLLFGTVRGHLLEHDAFGEYIVAVHTLRLLFVIILKIIVKLVLEVLHLVDFLILYGDVVVLTHSAQFVLQLAHVLGTVYKALLAELDRKSTRLNSSHSS